MNYTPNKKLENVGNVIDKNSNIILSTNINNMIHIVIVYMIRV